MMRTRQFPTVAAAISSCLQARVNCQVSGNVEWRARWSEYLELIAKDLLPRGSGIDFGTEIDIDASTADRLVLTCSYHRMNEHGMYCGWYSYRVIVRPMFEGLSVDVRGRNTPEDAKDYIVDTFAYVLGLPCTQTADPADLDTPAIWQLVYPESRTA